MNNFIKTFLLKNYIPVSVIVGQLKASPCFDQSPPIKDNTSLIYFNIIITKIFILFFIHILAVLYNYLELLNKKTPPYSNNPTH